VLPLKEAWYRSTVDPCSPPHTEIKDEESGCIFLAVNIGVRGTGNCFATQDLIYCQSNELELWAATLKRNSMVLDHWLLQKDGLVLSVDTDSAKKSESLMTRWWLWLLGNSLYPEQMSNS
jgi:hypothetical protein